MSAHDVTKDVNPNSRDQLRSGIAHITISCGWYYATSWMLGIYFTSDLGLSGIMSGALLFVYTFFSRASRVLVANVGARLGARNLLLIAHAGAAVGYVILSLTKSYLALVAGLSILGFSFAVTATIGRVLISVGADRTNSAVRFSALHVAVNVASATLPFTCAYFYNNFSREAPFYIGMFIALCGVFASAAQKDRISASISGGSSFRVFLMALTSKFHMSYFLTSIIVSCLQFQFYTVVPFDVQSVFNSPKSLGYVYLLDGLTSIILAIHINMILARQSLTSEDKILIGTFTYFVGVAIYCGFYSLAALLFATFFWSLANMIIIPAFHSIVSDRAPVADRANLFSLNAVGIGLGQGAGAMIFMTMNSTLNIASRYSLILVATLILFLTWRLTKRLKRY